MGVYLHGGPVSTRKSKFGRDVPGYTVESGHLALMHRAMALHAASPSGLDIAAQRLKCVRTVSQLRQARGEQMVILVWIWLSDDSRFRVAWVLQGGENALYRSWTRVPWGDIVFSQGSQRRASSSRSQAAGSAGS